jgi:hypothetical protein
MAAGSRYAVKAGSGQRNRMEVNVNAAGTAYNNQSA